MGIGTIPANYSLPMVPVFNIDGPTNAEYQDHICLQRVPLPAGVTVSPGDNATIQIVEAAKHGAALYSVSQPVYATCNHLLKSYLRLADLD